MDDAAHNLDWSLVRAFLAVAETGSLSAAARQLGTSQPTLGRQIRAIERALKAELFHRQSRGLVLTETGTTLLAPARAMRDAASHIALSAAGQSTQLGGTVRITASAAMSVYHLPQIFARIRQQESAIALELVPSDASSNLLYREADIAVRMYRPTQLDLVTQHLGDVRLAAFAARSYIKRRGMPRTRQDFLDHEVVGYDRNPAMLDGFKAAGLTIDRDWFHTRCDDNIVYWELVRAGCGIGFAQATVGRQDPNLQEIAIDFDLPVLPVWLTAHEAMRRTPRIRRVWDLLADGLAPLMS